MTIGALGNRIEQLLLLNLFGPTANASTSATPVADHRLGLWSASPSESSSSSVASRNVTEDGRHLTRFPDQSDARPPAAPMTFTTPASGTATNANDVTITLPAGGIVTHIAVEGVVEGGSTVILYAELTTATGVAAPVTVPAGGTFRLPSGALTIRLDDGTSAMALSDWAEQAALNWLLKSTPFPAVNSHDLRLLTAANPESVANPSGFTQDRATTDPRAGDPNWTGHTSSTVFNNTALTFSAIPASTVLTHLSIVGQVRGTELASPTTPSNIFPQRSSAHPERQPVIVGASTTALDVNDGDTSYVLLPKSNLTTNSLSFVDATFDKVTTIPVGAVITKVVLRLHARMQTPATGITNLRVVLGGLTQAPVEKVVTITSTVYAEYSVDVPVTVTQAEARDVIGVQGMVARIESSDASNGTVLNDIRLTAAFIDISYANTAPQALANGPLGASVTTATGSTVSLTPGAVRITLD